MEVDKNNLENTQIVKVEEISLSTMDLQQQRMAERLYSQLGLDPVVDKVLKEYKSNLRGMDRATDTVFGPYDIKGRAESAAKVAALMTYTALHEQYSKEIGAMQEQIGDVESQRDRERANYDSLVQKVADVVGGDYDEMKTSYDEVVKRLAEVDHLKSQIALLHGEKSELTQRYDAQLALAQQEKADLVQKTEAQLAAAQQEKADLARWHEGQLAAAQQEKAETVNRYELQLADSQKERAETVSRYEDELAALREEFSKAADDLRAQINDRGERISVLEKEKATVIGERESLATQLDELHKAHADLESRHVSLSSDHAKLRAAAAGIEGSVDYADIRKRMGPEMHDFVLKDSKVPDAVIDGVGKFIDIKKYLGHAAEAGAREGAKRAAEVLKNS
jgi:chromosome segregation ATPase